MKYLKNLFLFGLLFFSLQLSAYDVVERFKLLDDKFQLEESLRPFGHDFIFDLNLFVNKNLFEVVDDAKKASETEGDTTAKLTAAQVFLDKYEDTEQTVRFRFNLGAPLPTFRFGDLKIVPDVRLGGGVGVNLGIRAEPFSFARILDFVKGVPPEIKAAILSAAEPDPGEDIIQNMLDNNPGNTALSLVAQPFLNKYFRPNLDSIPNIAVYAKAQGDLGFLFNFFYRSNWFGYLKLYAMGRADFGVTATADSLAREGDIVDFPDELNTHINLTSDFKLGYKRGNLRGFFEAKEIKMATMSDRSEESDEFKYGDDSLLRVHAEYLFKPWYFKVEPFVGAHKRGEYGWGDGTYVGVHLGFHVWGDRIGVRLRGMMDQDYLTISPKIKMWLMHMEYSLKSPRKKVVDDVKLATIHSLNLRFFL